MPAPDINAGSSSGALPPAMDPAAVIRSRAYLSALVLATLLGVPISAIAYGFLALVSKIQQYLFADLPKDVFDGGAPAWWPVPFLVLCGLLTGLSIRHLPGNGGHSPAFGFAAGGGPPIDRELPGIVLASFTTLALGAVLGPEAPLIAVGGGLAALVVHQLKTDAPPMAVTIMASAGSFAAISTLLGSPLLGAFLIMEAAGIAGTTLILVALPGLLAAGVGTLVFVGLDSWTGLGDFSLALTSLPPEVTPTPATLAWALPLGAASACLGWVIRWSGLSLRPVVHRSRVLVTSLLGLGIGLTAMVYQLLSNHSFKQVLFSGQSDLPDVVAHATDYSVGALLLLAGCKTLVYGLSLSAFRGGPVFPAIFIGAVLGIAASGLPGMAMTPAIGIGIGAMCTAMLRLPLTSTLLATLLLGANGLSTTPEIVIAVAVAYVVSMLLPVPGPGRSEAAPAPPSETDVQPSRGTGSVPDRGSPNLDPSRPI
ncbi:MAG: chloride channel protein [Aeromicrobium sp.]|jgi:H+/Cl- antiporter ClcA|nr:chloride channel protein [Glaciihabitans sp.]MCW2825699.1 chloride channel protein [Aeromicrobium sp.]